MSLANKMRMQTLREQGYGARAIVSALYPLKNWKLSTVKKFAGKLMQQVQGLNARPAVVDRNPCAWSQTSNVLKSSFAVKTDRAAIT